MGIWDETKGVKLVEYFCIEQWNPQVFLDIWVMKSCVIIGGWLSIKCCPTPTLVSAANSTIKNTIVWFSAENFLLLRFKNKIVWFTY